MFSWSVMYTHTRRGGTKDCVFENADDCSGSHQSTRYQCHPRRHWGFRGCEGHAGVSQVRLLNHTLTAVHMKSHYPFCSVSGMLDSSKLHSGRPVTPGHVFGTSFLCECVCALEGLIGGCKLAGVGF